MSSIDDLVSTKELASKLKVTEPLLKKLIKDFNIETQRVDKRAHLDTKASTTVKEILALRASGKKNSEIKEMFDSSKKTTKTEKQEAKSKEATEEPAAEEKPKKKIIKKPIKKKIDPKTKKTKKEAEEEVVSETVEEAPEQLATETTVQEAEEAVVEAKPETKHVHKDTRKPNKESNDNSVIDISSYLHEDEEEDSDLKELLKVQAGDEEISSLDDDDDEVEEDKEFTDATISPRKIRRRQFSFKYIQRQIANDSKRVNYIKQKLSRGRLSVKETAMLEDSLHHRAILLSGWIQLLRWVKN